MNYSSGVWGLGSIAVAQQLPAHQLLWLLARILLDTAGGLFLVYLLLLSGVTAVALVAPGRRGGQAVVVPGSTARRGEVMPR